MKCLVVDVEQSVARIEDRDDVVALGDPVVVDLSGQLRNEAALDTDEFVLVTADSALFAEWVRALFCWDRVIAVLRDQPRVSERTTKALARLLVDRAIKRLGIGL